ncbi:oxidoreductase [Zopfia rhizophila CBS 207.26]|uniref:Oxidoreductase n=1 Tax=Zopfia rhizophila CBS 207.26 TaxID=1314779 RepID=A0A6A6ETD6_9PEZI|nr:oxidoreductase [Zopfia rhizophila CBS 207.26]
MPKSVLITGCSAGGIGFSLAKSFQNRGVTVFATARDLSKMSGLEKLPNIVLLPLDVTSPSSIADVVEAVKAKTGGKLDYLVNNSGRQYVMPALDADIEEGKRMFDVNFWGVLRMIQAFSELLVESKGTIVNIGSIAAYLHSPYSSMSADNQFRSRVLTDPGIYNASKAALHMFDETLRIELAPLGVEVLTIVTGSIETAILTNGPQPKVSPSSHYYSLEKDIKERAKGNDGYKRMKADEFAEGVVGDVLRGATGKVWRGENATATRIASVLMPMPVMDRVLLNGTRLENPKS